MTFRRTFVVVILVLAYAPNGNTTAAQAGDFGFRFAVEHCWTERLDTFSGIFTKNLGGWPARTVTAPIMLTDAQMSEVYRTIEDIGFFDYPSAFVGVRKDAKEIMMTIPYDIYRFEVRNAGVVHTVSWKDSDKPTTVEADRLRDLFSMIRGFIYEHPEFKRLPRPTVACM
jgi:hypothetical protein